MVRPLSVLALTALILCQSLGTAGTATAQATDTCSVPFSVLARTWARRDATLHVSDSGAAEFRWRVGVCQSSADPQPCDDAAGGPFYMGGIAEIFFTIMTTGTPLTTRGHVTLTNRPEMFRRGSDVNLVRVADDLVLLDRAGGQRVWLCRFHDNLPRAMRRDSLNIPGVLGRS